MSQFVLGSIPLVRDGVLVDASTRRILAVLSLAPTLWIATRPQCCSGPLWRPPTHRRFVEPIGLRRMRLFSADDGDDVCVRTQVSRSMSGDLPRTPVVLRECGLASFGAGSDS